MKDRFATQYMNQLSDLLHKVEVTDAQGRGLSFDAGCDWAIKLLLEVKAKRAKVMAIGNGGSSAIVSHLHNDLEKTDDIRSMVFQDTSLLTAITNDDGYENVYADPIKKWAQTGDLLIAISSSGMSQNIINAVEEAKGRGVKVIGFSGFNPQNTLRGMGELNFYVPNDSYGYVELIHGVLAHLFTDGVSEAIGQEAGEQHKGNSHVIITDKDFSYGRGGVRRSDTGS